jgi:hypothetical protein
MAIVAAFGASELDLVGEHGPLARQEIGGEIHPRGRVRDEGDLVGFRADELGDLDPDHLPAGEPCVP